MTLKDNLSLTLLSLLFSPVPATLSAGSQDSILGRKMVDIEGRIHTLPLVWIKDWDFRWQGQYLYSSPIRLPKGTKVEMTALYDNSEGNPRNPSRPDG